MNAYTKMPFTEEELSFITEVQHDYDKYKLHQKLWPIDLKGIQSVRKIIVKEYSLKDYTWNTNLKMIRISINAPVFTRITKDTSSKPVDQLSAIGGTFGLLTGFSLISAVEILYYAAKILNQYLRKTYFDLN